MRWGSIMTAVCYDVLNQVLFDKTVLSTSVFIVSPVSPSTKAGWWYVSVLVRWGVWGSALEWPAHLSGPTSWSGAGLSDRGLDCCELKSRECWPSKKPISALFCSLDQSYSGRGRREKTDNNNFQREWAFDWGGLFHVADFYEWESGSCLSKVGGCSLFKPEDPVVGWHVWFFPAVKQVLSERDGLQAFPLSSAVWMGCHTD